MRTNVAQVLRLLGARSIRAWCRSTGVVRADVYRAANGDLKARARVERVVGAGVVGLLFGGAK